MPLCVEDIGSRLGSEDFKELFLTTSLTRPRLLFSIKSNIDDMAFYSSPQPQNPYENSSLEVKADFHSKFPRSRQPNFSYAFPRSRQPNFSYASGLFYFHDRFISTAKDVICNPSTRRCVIVPELRKLRRCRYIDPTKFLGFDPIDNQFKLLAIDTQASRVNNDWVGFVLTLGTGKMRWRTIRCPFLFDYQCICSNGISINGVLYYLARDFGGRSEVIVCFDVRTETFKFKPIVFYVEGGLHQLINYNGILAITILWKYYDDNTDYDDNMIELYMLVLEDEDVETEEWWEYTLPSSIEFDYTYVVGMTSTDEIVLSTTSSALFSLYYLNLENNSLQNVKVQGLEDHYPVNVIMDYVEDLYVNDAKYFKSNIHAKPQEAPGTSKRQRSRIKFESINTFEALCLSDEEDNDDA